MTNHEIKTKAKESLSGRWLQPILACLMYGLLTTGLTYGITYSYELENSSSLNLVQIGIMLLSAPLLLGLIKYLMDFIDGKNLSFMTMWEGYQEFSKATILQLLVYIYTVLWALLFIVPGIIKAYSYSQSFYVLSENPDLTPSEAITISQELMDGHKLDLFILELSFIGWVILSILTLGIGFFWLLPYMQVSRCCFYNSIKPELNNIETKEMI